jgi:hypothetical protein
LKNDVHLLTQVLFILEKIGFFIFLFLFLLSSYYIGISLAENIYCINRKISRLLGKQFWLVLLTQANRKKLVGCCVLKQHQFLFFQFIQLFVCTDENANLTFIYFHFNSNFTNCQCLIDLEYFNLVIKEIVQLNFNMRRHA